MTVVICMLRGVNVGGSGKINMEELRDICVSLKLRSPKTYIQSGNVVFCTTESDLGKLALRIESGIEKRLGFRPSVMLRTTSQMRQVVARNPFAARSGLEPAKLAVFFLSDLLPKEIRERVLAIKVGPEDIRCDKGELYIYFPDGMGRSKLPPALGRSLKMPATARNWNTVLKLLAMAEELEASS
jgi:uncharacterized protein (DUF1697 family)